MADTAPDPDASNTEDAAPGGSPRRSHESVSAATAAAGPLTVREVEVLEFAQLRWRYPGAMESQVRARFGWTLTRYFQVLDALTDRPEAALHAPQLVARLARLRETRRRARTRDTGDQV